MAALLFFPLAACAQFNPSAQKALTDLIETKLKASRAPSISIALVRGDSIVWKAAFGHSNLRTQTPASPETLYNAASTFKAVTAASILQLAEQGKLKLEDPVNRYLGDTPIRDRLQSDQPVNFVHLLSHWSGLTAWPGRVGSTMKPIWSLQLPKSLEHIAAEIHSIGPPEKKFEYNNYGYGIAGLLIEKISGMKYEDYVRINVLKPLGIKTPNPVSPTPEMVEMMALPYEVAQPGQRPRPAPQVHAEVHPAGNAYLTAEDMARFLAALLNGGAFQAQRILSPASVERMLEPRFGGNYALGLRIKRAASGHTLVRHTGRLPGMSSMMLADVDARAGVYYMTNSADDPFEEVGEAALALLLGDPYPPAPRKSISVETAVLDRYAGVYESENAIFTVTREGSALFLQKNRNPKKGELLAETPTAFFLKDDPATVYFESGRMVVVSRDWIASIFKRR